MHVSFAIRETELRAIRVGRASVGAADRANHHIRHHPGRCRDPQSSGERWGAANSLARTGSQISEPVIYDSESGELFDVTVSRSAVAIKAQPVARYREGCRRRGDANCRCVAASGMRSSAAAQAERRSRRGHERRYQLPVSRCVLPRHVVTNDAADVELRSSDDRGPVNLGGRPLYGCWGGLRPSAALDCGSALQTARRGGLGQRQGLRQVERQCRV